MPITYKKIRVPIYYQYLHIIISDNVEKDIDKINKRFHAQVERYDFAGYCQAVGKHYLLLLNLEHLKDDEPFAISTIAHEAFHITNFIMKRVGIKADVENDEPQAYLLSWIMEEACKLYLNEKEKSKESNKE